MVNIKAKIMSHFKEPERSCSIWTVDKHIKMQLYFFGGDRKVEDSGE